MEFNKQFRTSDLGYSCMNGMPAIDLNALVTERRPGELNQFCYQTSFMLALAQDFVTCRFGRHGAMPQWEWCFTGAILPPASMEEGEFVLRVTRTQQGDARYKLCIHGNESLRRFMEDQCLLHADLSDGTDLWSSMGYGSEIGMESDRESTLFYELTVPPELTMFTLDLLPRN